MLLRELITRARRLATTGSRRLLGITGPPGAGKSTLAEVITSQLADMAVLVPMDGFHLSNLELERLGRRSRKGAPDTFDAEGFVALLQRLKAADDPVVYAPGFRREVEEAISAAIPVPREVPLAIVEGNYLLLPEPPWGSIRALLDECWYLDMDPAKRIVHLIDRHVHHGKTHEEAEEWVRRSDEANARLVATTRARADLVVVDLEAGCPQD